jgi:hypothetical protein
VPQKCGCQYPATAFSLPNDLAAQLLIPKPPAGSQREYHPGLGQGKPEERKPVDRVQAARADPGTTPAGHDRVPREWRDARHGLYPFASMPVRERR